jgi:predicted nucleic acid-binding protein
LVFVDTNVLYPVRLADLVLSSVDDGLFDLCTSDHLLEEVERVLVNAKGLPVDKAGVFRNAVQANAAVHVHESQYAPLRRELHGPDADDLWHLAAAITAGADVIITADVGDFANADIPPGFQHVEALDADDFFDRLASDGLATDLTATVRRIAARLKHPPRSPAQIVDGLQQIGLAKTVAHLRRHLSES